MEMTDEEIRAARNQYMREYRNRPGVMERTRRENSARTRALWRLAELHYEEYRRLYVQELRKP